MKYSPNWSYFFVSIFSLGVIISALQIAKENSELEPSPVIKYISSPDIKTIPIDNIISESFSEIDSVMQSGKNNLLFITANFNWPMLNSASLDYKNNKISLQEFNSEALNKMDKYSLSGIGPEMLKLEINRLNALKNLQGKIQEIKTIESQNASELKKINESNKKPVLVTPEKSYNFLIIPLVQIILAISIIGFSRSKKFKKINHSIESFDPDAVSATFSINGQGIGSLVALNNFLKPFLGEGEKIDDWNSVAELLQLKNLYSINGLADGYHHIRCKLVSPTKITQDINLLIQKNSSKKNFKILCTTNRVTTGSSVLIPTEEFKEMGMINVQSSLENAIEENAHLLSSKGIMVHFNENTDHSVRILSKEFNTNMSDLIKTLAFKFQLQGSSGKEMHICVTKKTDQIALNINLVGLKIENQDMVSHDSQYRCLEEIFRSLEMNLKYHSGKIDVTNTFDHREQFVSSNIKFECFVPEYLKDIELSA